MDNPQFLSWSLSNRAREVLFLATCCVMKSLLRTDPWFCVLEDKPLSFSAEFSCTLTLEVKMKMQIFYPVPNGLLIVM